MLRRIDGLHFTVSGSLQGNRKPHRRDTVHHMDLNPGCLSVTKRQTPPHIRQPDARSGASTSLRIELSRIRDFDADRIRLVSDAEPHESAAGDGGYSMFHGIFDQRLDG